MQRLKTIIPIVTLIVMSTILGVLPAFAQDGPKLVKAQNLALFTHYPDQEIGVGEAVTLGLTLRAVTTPQTVHLSLQDLPDGWDAVFKGDGRIVEAAYVEPDNDTSVDLKVEPAKDTAPGTYDFSVIARGDDGEARLPIELVVKDKVPPSLDFSTELPTLRGTPDTTFRYNATLKNEGDEDLSINLLSEAPKGLQVSFKLSGQDVTNIPLAANESKHLSIEVKLYPDMPAGNYPINVTAQGGEVQAETALTAEVTGQPELTVTAPDGRLSGQAYVGDNTPLKLMVQNTGSASARNIALDASQPNGWSVEFEPKQIAEVPSGQQVEVTANIKPAEQAIAGDYVVTVHARPEDGPSKSADFRITVLTSTLWGIVGIALIAVAVAVVGLAVMRFGRR